MTAGTGTATGIDPGPPPPAPDDVTGPSLRARTDLRFAVLVAAVLASSVVAFSVVWAALPSAERLSQRQVSPCLARIDPATAWITDALDRANTRTAMANACERPYIRHEIGWIAAGIAAEVAVALLLYALHPWWPRTGRRPAGRLRLPRWSGKVRLSGDENADVLKELDALADRAGLSRSPLWLVDPYATTAGGRAYGLPGRPRVCLDVGLLIRYDLDLAGFRAVVRHELAHHHHRDVGRTYLTIALWRSFVATALAPCVLLSLYPGEKPAYRMVALAVLSATAYLARNTILRTRELHADALAHTWDADRSALPRVVSGLPWPPVRTAWRWLPAAWLRRVARIGTHPSPERRLEAMTDPAQRLRTGVWETAGLGLLAGLALDNLSLLTGNATERFATVGLTLLALPYGVVLAVALASAPNASNPSRRSNAARDVLLLPAALTAGVVGSRAFSLVAADVTVMAPTLGQYAVFGIVNLALLVQLALWVRSVRRRRTPTGPGAARGPRTGTLVVTAAVVWGPLLALWHARAWDPSTLTTSPLHAVPAVGRTIGWYAALTGRLADAAFYLPLAFARATPLLPTGLVLVWAVPLMSAGRRRGFLAPSQGVGRALAVGAAAGLAAVVAGIALPYAARGALPPEVRRASGPSAVSEALSFPVVHAQTYLAVAALFQAAAAAGTVLVCRRQRPVLVPLAVTVTAVLGTLGFYVSRGTSRCVAVTDLAAGVCGPRAFLPDADTAVHLHEVVAWGVVAAVPAGLLGAAVAALSGSRRRRPGSMAETAHVDTPRRRSVLLAPALGLPAVLLLAGAAAGIPDDYPVWRATPVAASPPPLNGRGASASSDRKNDPCLLGTWRVSAARQRLRVEGSPLWLTGGGGTWTFRPDGTLVVDHGENFSEAATLNGRPVVLHATGSVSVHFLTADGVIGYYGETVRRPGELTVRLGGTYLVRQELTAGFTPDHYTCTERAVRLSPPSSATGSSYEMTLTRLP
ncbi:M48 family metalloprotease [Streptomyces aureus]|uniref:M48 family metalloprotease n=1 Tax=Streptomyces aureus TaxID=193461 RepID=UPI00056B83C7|nr:M48 family metalloprotease [Streptomyces aureus]